ncbi:uncharacterized protein LOC111242038 [Vigna radiata var. radiata]|uniref:Uncharacterized protein LOC111242038 n=1 Tax=Vigna radiata var. radiata TaxID=3916 RepID=A0A3Q0F976_VIGRR|nr:uncharacterized protein LOC111242038 [Vigna radiata var. radiata]
MVELFRSFLTFRTTNNMSLPPSPWKASFVSPIFALRNEVYDETLGLGSNEGCNETLGLGNDEVHDGTLGLGSNEGCDGTLGLGSNEGRNQITGGNLLVATACKFRSRSLGGGGEESGFCIKVSEPRDPLGPTNL